MQRQLEESGKENTQGKDSLQALQQELADAKVWAMRAGEAGGEAARGLWREGLKRGRQHRWQACRILYKPCATPCYGALVTHTTQPNPLTPTHSCMHPTPTPPRPQAEAERQKKRANSVVATIIQTCNKEKLPIPQWKVAQAAKERRLVELEERVKAMEGQAEVRAGR